MRRTWRRELRLSAADDPEVARRYAYTLTLRARQTQRVGGPGNRDHAAVSSAAPRGESGPSPSALSCARVDDSSVAQGDGRWQPPEAVW